MVIVFWLFFVLVISRFDFFVLVVFADQVVSLDLYVWYHQEPGRKISFETALMNIWTNKKDPF